MKIQYMPQGVCSKLMELDIEDNKILSAQIIGGCHGNLRGICQLVKGMGVTDVIKRLEGIKCGPKSTSCPDQLAKCLALYLKEHNVETEKV